MARTMSDFPLSWAFFDACSDQSPSHLRVDKNKQIREFGRILTPPEIGCTKSHYHVLDSFAEDENAEWLLVLEDDVTVDSGFDYVGFVNFIAKRQISHARLFVKYFRNGTIIDWFGSFQLVRMGKDPFGAQAYFISREAARQFQRKITHVVRPMDDEYARYWADGFPIHTIFPFPVLERTLASTQETARRSEIDSRSSRPQHRSLSRWHDAVARRMAHLLYRMRRPQ